MTTHEPVILHRHAMPLVGKPNEAMPACKSDACCSGRKECPTPDACRLPLQEDEQNNAVSWGQLVRTIWPGLAWGLLAVGVLAAVLA